ncbi:5631_t:CDS:1 [Ambispora leptoticha]|uniref:5631_t:CDS:1 n=1 Tax=Ambispora leptoticha TaxID=144679 RepID=A0A9N9G4D7_9GLOM|nr:5631_t:CDS:1 [Ambispora leptoticha]
MSFFLVTSKFIKTVFQLRKQIKDTLVTEIRITNDTIMCYNREGEPVLFEFSQEITTISLEQARMSLYLNDLKRTDIPTRSLEEVHGETWEDQVIYIRDKMRQNRLDQVSLLQYYYLLGERLEAQFWSPAARMFIRINFSISAYHYTWKAASRVYQLYHTRGTHNLLTVQNITANALLRLSDKNFKALVEEARLFKAAEVDYILGEAQE